MAQRYMLQISSNFVYAYHPLTVKKPDMVEISEAQAKNILAGRSIMDGLTAKDAINVVPGSAERGPEIRPIGAEDQEKTRIAMLEKKLSLALTLLGMKSPDELPDDVSEGSVIMDDLEKGQDLEVPTGVPEDAQGPATIPDNIQDDPDIKMLEEIRINGKGKARIETYCLKTFGVNVDRRMRLNELVDQAVRLRKELLRDTGEDSRPIDPDTPLAK